MNSKKSKNKNRPNKPNPCPPQKVEDIIPTDKEVQQEKEVIESASKIEERVPEIVSEVKPVIESEIKKDETPKKPKRNRGKKKQDTDIQDETQFECEETKVELEVVQTEVVSDIPDVAPSARKKKNKGKKASESTNISEKNNETVVLEDVNKTEILAVEATEKDVVTGESLFEQEIKSSKRKNKKKKNRNDSEKSDKAEELSCVTAFQKILKDDKDDIKAENISSGTSGILKVIPSPVETPVEPEVKKDDILDASKQPVTESSKGKKKNKRDKKVPPTEDIKETAFDPAPEKEIEKEPFSSFELRSDQAKEEITKEGSTIQKISIENIISGEDSSKPKAKIAKSVERKHKGKSIELDTTTDDVKTLIVEDDLKHSKQHVQHMVYKTDDTPVKEKTAETKETLPLEIDSKLMPSSDILPMPETELGKKGKRSPKLKKHQQTGIEEKKQQTEISSENIVFETEELTEKKSVETKEIITPSIEKECNMDIKNIIPLAPERSDKKNKSSKSKKHQQMVETDETQLPPVSVIADIRTETNILEAEIKFEEGSSKATIEHTTPSKELETKMEIENDVLLAPISGKDNKRKKSRKPNERQPTAASVQTETQKSMIADISSENEVFETEMKPKESSKDQMQSTNPSIEKETKIEVESGVLLTPIIEKGDKRKKSPKPDKHQATEVADQSRTPISMIADICSETNVLEREMKPEESSKYAIQSTNSSIDVETKIESKNDVLQTPIIETGNKRKKSPKPNKRQLPTIADQPEIPTSMTADTCDKMIDVESEIKPEERSSKDAIERTTQSTEMEAKTEKESDVLLTPITEKNYRSKKSPKPNKRQPNITLPDQIHSQISMVAEICTETKVLETEIIPEVKYEEKLKDNIKTTPIMQIDTATVMKSDRPISDTDMSKKETESSKQKKQHHQFAESEQAQFHTIANIPSYTEKFSSESELRLEEEKKLQETVDLLKTDTVEKLPNLTPELKTKKKRKKSPKPLMDPEPEPKTPTLDEEIIKEVIIKEKPESFSDFPFRDEIEISSLKADESEGSTCGVTPDIIQYPRATSQDLIDNNNNNMIIQEITVIEETRLQIPFQISDTPLICGSGETPLTTPEINIAGSKIKIDEPKDSEKTDLKSKMMEVNQDMEELRLSIERSLAELTSMEKNEEVDQGFANTMLVITEETLNMPNENVAKSETKKDDAYKSKESFSSSQASKIETCFESVPTSASEPFTKDVNIKTESISQPVKESGSDRLNLTEFVAETISPPICPARKDNKNKGKSKKKGKQEIALSVTQSESTATTSTSEPAGQEKSVKKEEKSEQKTEGSKEKGKQQSELPTLKTEQELHQEATEFEPIEKFEDAMTSSADDINKSFEIIAHEANQMEASHVNPEINIIAPIEDTKKEKRDEKVNPLSQPKNLLGHPDIPVPSNRMDYKKEKNRSPNEILAKVKIKDSIEVEAKRQSKESQTDNIRKFMKNKSIDESFSLVNENDDFVYKYSFRRVFLQSSCHICKKDLKQSRVPCSYCNLVFYCNGKHKDEDWLQHQALCFAVSTIAHLKDQKHIYADAKNVTGQNYRLLRMQMIVSCEKVLKRRLVPWEQEALLYPRICADVGCREWRQSKLLDCDECGQISYCAEHPEHLPKSHQRWCKSYSLYQKLVSYQQTKGRLEPKLPSKIVKNYQMPEKMNEVLASMYEEKIDMNDIQYATLTQIATAPLTAAYCYQLASKYQTHANGTYKKTCTIHVVDAELQFEADALNKWEIFFLHLTAVDELRVVMVSVNLNPGNLPLELLSKIKLCENCRVNNRRVIFSFQDKQSYHEYWASEDYITPNIVCAFNANINRSSMYTMKDQWPKTINCILKQRVPFLLTDHTLNEIHKDFARIKESAECKYEVIVEPKTNNFASVRPDRNFISDDEMPLLFKNYCFALFTGVN